MELFGIPLSPALIWIGIAVIFAVIEAFTLGLTTIWFSAGAVAAALTALVTDSILIQVIVFLVVSCVLLYFTKPLANKKLKIGQEKTNVEALPGKGGLVTARIAPYQTGQVKADGQIWTAVASREDQIIEAGTQVVVLRVEGVKLVVEPAGPAED